MDLASQSTWSLMHEGTAQPPWAPNTHGNTTPEGACGTQTQEAQHLETEIVCVCCVYYMPNSQLQLPGKFQGSTKTIAYRLCINVFSLKHTKNLSLTLIHLDLLGAGNEGFQFDYNKGKFADEWKMALLLEMLA